MRTQTTSLKKRVLAMVLTIVMVFGMLPTNVIAADTGDYGTVTTFTGGNVVGSGTDKAEVTITSTTLQWVEATALRAEGWWVGINVTAPVNVEDLTYAKLRVNSGSGFPETWMNFVDCRDTERTVELWFPVSAESLSAGTNLVRTYEFDWNGQGDKNQTIVFSVVPSKQIVLMKGEEQVYPDPKAMVLTVNKVGNGTVKIGDAEVTGNTVDARIGEEVKVEITPAAGSYISKLTVAGETKTVTKGEAYSENLTFTGDAVIDVTFVAEHTVNVTANEGGAVTLNGAAQTALTVDEGTQVTLNVDAADGYQIHAVSVGGVAETVSDVDKFSKTITVNQDTDVSVTFVKVYKITVSYDGNGGVTVDEAAVSNGGTVTVFEGTTTATLVAAPAAGFRVSAVDINGETENFDIHAHTYTKTLNMDKDYAVEVTFAQSVYNVTITTPVNGTVTIDDEDGKVDHGASTTMTVVADDANGYEIQEVTVNGQPVELDENGQYTISSIKADQTINAIFKLKEYGITIAETENGEVLPSALTVAHGDEVVFVLKPAEGYSVGTVTVNGEAVTSLTENEDDTVKFTVFDVKEAKNVVVTFVETETASEAVTSLFNSGDAVRVSGMTYVFKKDAKIEFSTTYSGIYLLVDGKAPMGGKNIKTVTLNESSVVNAIALRYRAGNSQQNNWHWVPGVTQTTPLNLVIDTTPVELTLVPAEANANGYYNDDVTVAISAKDLGDYSGIASVKYWITTDGTLTKEDELLTVNNVGKESWDGSITVDAQTNNSDNVVVVVEVTDKAGNVTRKEADLKINSTAPVLESVEVVEETKNAEAEDGYYTKRVIKLTITDRASTFDAEAAKNGIFVTATNSAGSVQVKPSLIDSVSSGNTHEVTVEFTADANYRWGYSYTNLAGMAIDMTGTPVSAPDIYKFTVDNTAPTGSIQYNANVWETLLETLTFGIWSRESMVITATHGDATSQLKDIQYFKANQTTALTIEELEEQFKSGKFTTQAYTISEDQKFVVYARLLDFAGNVTYIGTDGMVYDNTESMISIVPEKPNKYGFYNKDVKVAISVSEITTEGADYSGIKTVDYKVVIQKNGESRTTQEENLFTFNVKNPTYEQLIPTVNKEITVKKGMNNADNVKVIVTAVDNAGKVSTMEVPLSINVDDVQATIEFTDAANKIVGDRGYFKAENRVATIKLTDRASAFDKEAATAGIQITAVDAAGNAVENAYTISDWSSNGNVHTATVTFHADANYTWSFNYTNKADNALDVTKNLKTGESVTPFVFTVDDTDPFGTAAINTDVWENLLETLTFGLYSKESFTVVATAEDQTSPVVIQYYKTDKVEAMTAEELDAVQFVDYTEAYTESNKQQKSLTVSDDERFVVYQKITDYAGNSIYLNADGAIVDQTPAKITLKPAAANSNGVYGLNYNGVVTVDVSVQDQEPYSGIKTVDYWIVKDGNTEVPTQSKNLYTFSIAKPIHEQLTHEWTETINVDTALNNSSDVEVFVKVVDNAGNETVESVKLDIDVTKPAINVSYDDNAPRNDKYFDNDRVATVVITERTNHFDPVAATNGIQIEAVNAKGEAVEIDTADMISNWVTKEGATPDEATHTATITYSTDANYTFAISYTGMADNANQPVNYGESKAPVAFTVDHVDPVGTITGTSAEGRVTTWDALIKNLTFGFWSGEKITITSTSDDVTSPIESVKYYKVSDSEALTLEALKAVTAWTDFADLEVLPDEQFTVYLQITDFAGNVTYISTNGMIVDNTDPREEAIAPEITIDPVQPINDLYNGDVKVSIKVVDPTFGNTFAGLKTVGYRVLNMGVVTQEEILHSFENEDPTKEDLLKIQEWTGEIVVDSKLNNSNDVVIEVYAEDNALNYSEDSVAIQIDITAPTIDISYDNNQADSGTYYKADRTATIVVTERNFNAEDVLIEITKDEEVFTDYIISDWVTKTGTGNLDDTTHTVTILYNADGDYTFNIAYTDLANIACAGAVYAEGTTNPNAFTIDKTKPVVQVSYNNNDVENEKYFDATRTATITITEHNFPLNDIARVVFTQTADRGGVTPTVRWTHNGDTHIATFSYSEDGDYTFDVTMQDLAGNASDAANYGNSAAGKDFVIDTTFEEMITLGGVENGKAYGYDASIVPTLDISDINLEDYTVTLVGVQKDTTIDLTSKVNALLNASAEQVTGNLDLFEVVQDMDGIYTLSVNSKDKAGNQDAEEIVFTVNRFGSVYVYDQYLMDLIANGGAYVLSVTEDLVIMEYNADKLVGDSLVIEITCDGKPLENVVYEVTPEINDSVAVGESGWYQYKYTISKDNFASDGVYKISVSTKDATGNAPENNNYEDMGITFRIDSTQAEITSIVGLEEAIINATDVTVKYTVFDTMGLKSIQVYVDGQLVDEITDFTADLNNYTGSFVLGENSSAQSVRIVVEDLSGNITDTDAEDFSSAYIFNKSVTVSTNVFVRWYANKPLFWGSIAGVTAVAGGLWFFLAKKRKKKEEEEVA